MQSLFYQIVAKAQQYRTLLSTIKLSITALSLLFGISVFVGFVIVKQQDLKFTTGELRVKARETFETVKVAKVIDGDTIELADGRVVRYIGVNAPDKNECFARSATNANRVLLGLHSNNKVGSANIALEKDVSEVDKYGRLLRYVWVGDTLINEKLAAEGFARSMPIQPDLKYNARIYQAQRAAREQNLGMWEVCK